MVEPAVEASALPVVAAAAVAAWSSLLLEASPTGVDVPGDAVTLTAEAAFTGSSTRGACGPTGSSIAVVVAASYAKKHPSKETCQAEGEKNRQQARGTNHPGTKAHACIGRHCLLLPTTKPIAYVIHGLFAVEVAKAIPHV
eukprot:CAMPEP_0172699210 /NCGR_PEP_ID=MMETSP1074-20121228/30022_1 /TAXON_ID=2916 /ORGANISM="Ceratium fusus, Strain PA161109" /LENGTH=140 /DNA_ID=CAMNT_0013520381 /DNA_START=336 /DNA_END=757 /DNA_ORIENTATION=+